MFPDTRLRRLREKKAVRIMLFDDFPPACKFIMPLFAIENKTAKFAIPSMPGQFRMGLEHLKKEVENAVENGIGGIILFGVPEKKWKSSNGSYAYRKNAFIQKITAELKKTFKDQISIWLDLCLCSYTSTGHCGILNKKGEIDNDKTLDILAKIAVSYADTGADGVAPSAMMDGQVCEIRNALDSNGFHNTLIMSYSTKFASSFYGPFRDAAGSTPKSGDRKSYQLPPADLKQALREAIEDEKEGADILMVKPALFYLDVISELRRRTLLPIAAYNVSGEYSILHACAREGWGNLFQMARESLISISRAGADLIISYWASEYKRLTQESL